MKEPIVKPTLSVLLIAASALTATAQTVVVGSQPVIAKLARNSPAPYTLVDVTHPATADGTLTSLSVRWSVRSCTSAFKVKFLRPADPFSLTTFTVVAERGPFTAIPGVNQIALTPAVDVRQADLLAITSLLSYTACGSPTAALDPSSAILQLPGDVGGGTFSMNGTYRRGQALAARATENPEVLEGVITAAGSLQGAFGSLFRTSLQIVSPGGTSAGKLVFHPSGVPASPGDQVFPYTVSGATATSYADIVGQLGKSGLGTIDVISTSGAPPLVTARVYTDNGPSGTAGFTEDLITPVDALHAGDFAILLTPADLTNYRMNVGVRTLGAPATVNVQYGFRSQANQDFPANTFQQYSLASFGDPSPLPGEAIYLFVLSGDVIIYASTTDNRTNDSSIRFARRE